MPRKKPTSTKEKKAQQQLARAVKRGDEPPPPKLRPGQTRAPITRHTNASGPSNAAAVAARKLESAFIRLDADFLERTKNRASEEPLVRPIPGELALVPQELLGAPGEELTCPRRPKWRYENTKKEVERNEEAQFDQWKTKTDDAVRVWLESETSTDWGPSYYERNLEVWRQLWRVTEISDILIILVDSRLPPLHFPLSLQTYLNPPKGPARKIILVLTKADVSGPQLCAAWKTWLLKRHPGIRVVSAESYREKPRPSGQDNARPRMEPHIPPESLGELVEALKAVHQELITPPPAVQQDPEKLAAWKPRVKATVEWEKVMQAQDQKSLPKPSAADDDDDEAKEKPYLTLGLIGQPNVGKSSLLNALFGTHKVKASRTPGKTKHFQTLFWTPEIRLVDCPGLVMPNHAHLELQVLCGILPIARIPSLPSCIHYAGRFLPLEEIFDLTHPSEAEQQEEDKRTWRSGQRERLAEQTVVKAEEEKRRWTAMDVMVAFANKNGWKTAKAGRPDFQRAGNAIMRSLAEARVKWAFSPPTDDSAKPLERLYGLWLRDGNASTAWHGDDDAESEEEEEHASGEEGEPDAEHSEDAASADDTPRIPTGFGRFNILVEGDDDAEDESDEDEKKD